MSVTGIRLRDQRRKLLSCSKSIPPLFAQLHDGDHGFLLRIPLFRIFKHGPEPSCLASMRRWMCASNAFMSNSNAHRTETLFTQQGDEPSCVTDGAFEASQKHSRVDFAAASVGKDIKARDICEDFASVSVHDKVAARLHDFTLIQNVAAIADSSLSYQNDMAARAESNTRRRPSTLKDGETEVAPIVSDKPKNDAPELQGGHVMESQTAESLEDDEFEDEEAQDEEENLQLGFSINRSTFSQQDRFIIRKLWMLLEEKGWTESSTEFLETHRQKLSFPIVRKVLLWQTDADLASSLFQWVCEHMDHDITIYHAYLKALGEAKRFDEMWDFLVTMKDNKLQVSVVTFCIMIRACRVAGEIAMAVTVFNRAPEYGVSLSLSVHQALLIALFKSDLVKEARLFYSRMIQDGLGFDIHIYNSLIDGFGWTSHLEDVNKSFDLILKAGITPDLGTYKALISAYCNTSGVYSAVSVFSELRKRGLDAGAPAFKHIIQSLCKIGKLNEAMNLIARFQTSHLPDVRTLKAVLSGLLSGNQVSKAIRFFQIMEEGGFTNRLMYMQLCNGLRQCLQTTEIRSFLTVVFAKYGFSNVDVCLALLHNLTSLGDLVEAESLFKRFVDTMTEPNLWAYAIMINFYCRVELQDRALQLFSDLKNRGCKPTFFCYAPMISALLKASRVADAMKCFQEMQDYGYESNEIVCDFLLRELCKHDMVADVPEVLNTVLKNKFIVRTSTFFQLVKCMCRAGKIEETNIVFRSLYELKCIAISKEAAAQALSVIKVMEPSTNRKRKSVHNFMCDKKG